MQIKSIGMCRAKEFKLQMIGVNSFNKVIAEEIAHILL
jgi:hypothetical protein